MNITIRRTAIVAGLTIAALAPGASVGASGKSNGCNGLFEVARFATYQQVGDTHGHETVHHQLERHGCDHHHD